MDTVADEILITSKSSVAVPSVQVECRCREFVAIFLLEDVALLFYALLILRSSQCF